MHCQNAFWATQFLLERLNVTSRENASGISFSHFASSSDPETRGGIPFLKAKSFRIQHEPVRGVKRTAFGLDYLKHFAIQKSTAVRGPRYNAKFFELNHYDEENQPVHGYNIYAQRLSCYMQHKVQSHPTPQNFENFRLQQASNGVTPEQLVSHLESLDNGNTIIIFDNSSSRSAHDTMFSATQHWERKWQWLPFNLISELPDEPDDDRKALECMKVVLQDIWKTIPETWESLLDACSTHVSILEEKIYDQPADDSRAPELYNHSRTWPKFEKLVSAQVAILKEIQYNLQGFGSESVKTDGWLESSLGDMSRISDLVRETLTKPTANLSDLMYKSVEFRDSRISLQLNASLCKSILPERALSSFGHTKHLNTRLWSYPWPILPRVLLTRHEQGASAGKQNADDLYPFSEPPNAFTSSRWSKEAILTPHFA